jgi:hypothetical protein
MHIGTQEPEKAALAMTFFEKMLLFKVKLQAGVAR